MLSPLPRRSGWAYFAHSPSRISLPRKGRRVGLRIVLFEACSAFTRVAACTLALSPYIVTRYPKASANSLPPWLLRLLPAGAFAGWALHPLASAAFSRRTPEADIGHTELPRCSIQSGVLARLRQRTVSASSVRYRRRDKSRSGRTFWRYVDNSPWTRSLRGPR